MQVKGLRFGVWEARGCGQRQTRSLILAQVLQELDLVRVLLAPHDFRLLRLRWQGSLRSCLPHRLLSVLQPALHRRQSTAGTRLGTSNAAITALFAVAYTGGAGGAIVL